MRKFIRDSWSSLGYMLLLLIFTLGSVEAQRRQAPAAPTPVVDDQLHASVEWRLVGPFRGGRSAAVAGIPGQPNTFFFGATGGGVWKTENGGQTWFNISDGYFGGSIGAVTVSPSDPSVIYVGGGEKTVRGNVSYGYGMWKSTDGGKSWKATGLENSRHISRIRVHPTDPNTVYVAVMGDLFKGTQERGVYKTTNGGETWTKIHFANDDAGAVDLILDPSNPNTLYASTWRIRRTPYSLESGGEGSALWKSTDAGKTWMEISKNPGFATGTLGIIGVTVSPVNPNRVWAIAESLEGGVFRSDDGGMTWRKTNDDRNLRQRAWYYTRIYADTQDENTVYVLNVRYHKSTDGGRTFSSNNAPHGDHHDLWIAPEDPNRMVIADDGGAQVSFNGGQDWSTYMNQPTAQFYRVTTDNHFPYRIYGAQQDNSTMRIAHRNDGGAITENDWETSAGSESGWLAVDPLDNDIVYGGNYGGLLERVNHRTGESRSINVWPDNPMGHGAEGMKYRFQWNFPIFFSPHNPKKLYTTSNHVHVTTNEGQSWEIISPDLTRNDPSKLGPSGGPITKDNTSVEYYATIFAAMESPVKEGVIWTGSDDGLVHVTQDGGKNWTNVTPKDMPEWIQINSLEADPHNAAGAYIAGTMYKSGDYRPYLYKTSDYGKTWTKIVNGIDPGHFTRVIRADPEQKGLLFAGTETGMYISYNDGASWQSFQKNLPIVPITDLTIKEGNLIAATQGRSFWIIDDLTVIRQLAAGTKGDNIFYKPSPTYLMDGFSRSSLTAGTNRGAGVHLHYYLANEPTGNVKITFYDNEGKTIRDFTTKAKKGANTYNWNLRYPDAKGFEGMILWAARLTGPKIAPGTYKAEIKVGEQTMEQTFDVLRDPRYPSTDADLVAQKDFLLAVRDKVTETHETIIAIRETREQLNFWVEKAKGKSAAKAVADEAKRIDALMTAVEETLYQTKNRSGQDPLNYPIRLNNKLAHLTSIAGSGSYKPTDQAEQVRQELTAAIDEQITKWKQIKSTEIPKFNALIKSSGIEAIEVK